MPVESPGPHLSLKAPPMSFLDALAPIVPGFMYLGGWFVGIAFGMVIGSSMALRDVRLGSTPKQAARVAGWCAVPFAVIGLGAVVVAYLASS